MIRGVHHVAIHTPDLDRLATFYEQAFGFERVGEPARMEQFPEAAMVMGMDHAAGRVLVMKTHNCFIELFEWTAPEGRPLQPLQPNDVGYTHFMVDVTDIEEECERLAGLGMTFVRSSPVWAGGRASVYGRDPDGNIIEIGQIPADDELHLTAGGNGE